jgi:hypothetical protein
MRRRLKGIYQVRAWPYEVAMLGLAGMAQDGGLALFVSAIYLYVASG